MAREVNIFWFRRDLRLEDNVGFFKALHGKFPVIPLFIFDAHILDELPENDARVTFIHQQLEQLKMQFREHGGDLLVLHSTPEAAFEALLKTYKVQHVITNRDYEPYALSRDTEIEAFLSEKNIGLHTFKDHVIFEKDEILKGDGSPYVVYTPYSKTWRAALDPGKHLRDHDSAGLMNRLLQIEGLHFPSLEELGFVTSEIKVPDYIVSNSLIDNYEKTRNFPDRDGTSHLGPHLRFGTVRVRKMVRKALDSSNDVFLKELIWREFFIQILYHFPHTVDKAFKPKYDRIPWRKNEEDFQRWKEGKTGYPLVDAGMRQLNATGYMHNRVRMLVASFLCKHLLIDWRWGEAYFAEKLLDYEQASNVGNWQWASGSGVDAAPYFRIFNPITQVDKFDKDKKYIKTWVEEYETDSYCKEIIEHKTGRERALRTYKEALM